MIDPHVPFEMDARDPYFAGDIALWSRQTLSEMRGLVAATRRTIASSTALIAQVDRLLARK